MKCLKPHLIDSCHQFAQCKVLGIDGPEGQGCSQYEVRQGQVEEAYVRHSLQLYVPEENPENCGVACGINSNCFIAFWLIP